MARPGHDGLRGERASQPTQPGLGARQAASRRARPRQDLGGHGLQQSAARGEIDRRVDHQRDRPVGVDGRSASTGSRTTWCRAPRLQHAGRPQQPVTTAAWEVDPPGDRSQNGSSHCVPTVSAAGRSSDASATSTPVRAARARVRPGSSRRRPRWPPGPSTTPAGRLVEPHLGQLEPAASRHHASGWPVRPRPRASARPPRVAELAGRRPPRGRARGTGRPRRSRRRSARLGDAYGRPRAAREGRSPTACRSRGRRRPPSARPRREASATTASDSVHISRSATRASNRQP